MLTRAQSAHGQGPLMQMRDCRKGDAPRRANTANRRNFRFENDLLDEQELTG